MHRMNPSQKKLAEQLFAAKRAVRKARADLPIEQKIRCLIALQRLANDIRAKTGRPLRPQWDLESR